MTRLNDCFTDLMRYVVAFHETAAEKQPTYEQVRGDILRLLALSEGYAAKASFRRDDYDMARYAVCAWIDETVQATDWAYKMKWRPEPLQRVFYNSTDAGEKFFDRLNALGVQQNAVREVFYLCLTLGFEGRHCGPEGAYALQQLKAQHLKLLFSGAADVPTMAALEKNRLFPEAWPAGPAPKAPKLPNHQRTFTLAVLGGTFGLLVVLYSIYWFTLRSIGDNILRAVTQG